MMSEEEERPRVVKGGYGRHRRQWVRDSLYHTVLLKIYNGKISSTLSCKNTAQHHGQQHAVT